MGDEDDDDDDDDYIDRHIYLKTFQINSKRHSRAENCLKPAANGRYLMGKSLPYYIVFTFTVQKYKVLKVILRSRDIRAYRQLHITFYGSVTVTITGTNR